MNAKLLILSISFILSCFSSNVTIKAQSLESNFPRRPKPPVKVPDNLRVPASLDVDYQVFAPSAPSFGPQAIWKYGGCPNQAQVVVSNIGENRGGPAEVNLMVFWYEEVPDFIPSREIATTRLVRRIIFDQTLSLNPLNPGESRTLVFPNIQFPQVETYRLTAQIKPSHSSDPENNNQKTLKSYINHSCR